MRIFNFTASALCLSSGLRERFQSKHPGIVCLSVIRTNILHRGAGHWIVIELGGARRIGASEILYQQVCNIIVAQSINHQGAKQIGLAPLIRAMRSKQDPVRALWMIKRPETVGGTDDEDVKAGFHNSAAVSADSMPATVRSSE
jgi:hypothetical protein